jgi:hypothetical protein
MNRNHLGSLPVLLLLVAVPQATAAAAVDYVKEVKPILQARCYSCHGALRQRGDLRLDTGALIHQGGGSGPAVVPGKSADSLLIQAVLGAADFGRMPPEGEGEKLSDSQTAILRAWIDQGAKAPPEPIPPDPRSHWSFRVPRRPELPPVADRRWGRNPIDAFIAAEHERHGLRPSPEADRAVLLRRAYLDLVGLPPTRAELHAFLADTSPDAYEKVVDQLLASPQYGERWARHWMDVWRYSDWYGRRAVPDVWNSAPQIWRWRDWIIQSLNTDKGYDRMVMEMVAADEIAPGDDDAVVATGYLVRNWYALNPNQWMRDTVEHTGKAFLGLTFNCAHCHDHKYDPISQEEYFRFRAFFEPLQLRQDRVPREGDPGPFQKYNYTQLRKIVPIGLVRVFDEKLDAQTFMYAAGDERNRMEGKEPVKPGGPAFLAGDRLRIEPIALPAEVANPGLKPFIAREDTERREREVAEARIALNHAQRHLTEAQQRLQAIVDQRHPGHPAAPAVIDAQRQALSEVHRAAAAAARLATAEAELASLCSRIAADAAQGEAGESLSILAAQAERTAAVRAAQEKLLLAQQALEIAELRTDAAVIAKARQAVTTAQTALAAAEKAAQAPGKTYTPLSPTYPATSTGRRAALARWLASRSNPLTARVAVNHIWLRHFGKPLVETVFDFGRNGKPPSHPALLDWLAVELMDNDWSMKHLHRLIVTCAAYRQSSAPPAASVGEQDRDNRWLAHFPAHQVEAEVLRDAILHCAGQLDTHIGGPVLEIEQEPTTRRRSLYYTVHPEESGGLRFLKNFDPPDASDCYRRPESILPQQALALTNSRLMLDMSRLLARRIPGDAEEAFIVAAFEQVLSRPPSEQEIGLCQAFLDRQAALFQKNAAAARGEATVGPAPDPTMRARESLVRVLFSHDDFVSMR